MSNILEQLSQLVQQAVTQAVKAGTLPEISPDDLKIEISKPNKNFGGDYSCGVALTLTRALKRPPMQIGEAIEAAFPEAPDIVEKIWLTPPGFINFKLAHRWLTNNLKLIRDQGSSYADQDFGNQERVMIEFVSVNPTGPLHVGHARGAILGSALANILTKTGHAVWCEYYVNDAGTQNRIFQEAMYNLIHPKKSLAQYKVPPQKDKKEFHLSEKELNEIQSRSEKLEPVEGSPSPNPSIESLHKIVKGIPKNPQTKEDYYKRAKAYEEIMNNERAIEEYTKVIELDPDDGEAYYERAWMYLSKESSHEPEDDIHAKSDLKESIRRSSGWWFENACDLAENQFDIDDWTELLKSCPSEAELYYKRAKANFDKEDWDRVIADCDDIIKLDDKYREGDVYNIRGNAHFNKGDWDTAIADYTSMISLNPSDSFAYFNRALAYFNKRNWNKSIADYSHVISLNPLNPDDADAYFDRGAAYFNKQDWNQVIADYTEVIERKPTSKESYRRRGMAYMNLSDHRLALEDFTEAIRLDPYDSELYEMRSSAYEKWASPTWQKMIMRPPSSTQNPIRGSIWTILKSDCSRRNPT